MKKTLILFLTMAFLAFGFTPITFATGMDKSASSEAAEFSSEGWAADEGVITDEEMDTHEYFGSDEELNEGFDADRERNAREYFESDESFDADRDLDTRGYFGSDQDDIEDEGFNKGFDADRDLDYRRGG
jgi:hypothetical protein